MCVVGAFMVYFVTTLNHVRPIIYTLGRGWTTFIDSAKELHKQYKYSTNNAYGAHSCECA